MQRFPNEPLLARGGALSLAPAVVSIEREPLLIEPHAEGDDAATPLLRELHLARRRGLARTVIETRLRADGPRIIGDELGLDPLAFRLVCVPPDLYVRLGRERDWGRRDDWTHFDGYQLVGARGLRALVGGNARYGGLSDLCSISCDDARENTIVRFAVVRRERLGVRFGGVIGWRMSSFADRRWSCRMPSRSRDSERPVSIWTSVRRAKEVLGGFR
jgi:hypothetical protein